MDKIVEIIQHIHMQNMEFPGKDSSIIQKKKKFLTKLCTCANCSKQFKHCGNMSNMRLYPSFASVKVKQG